MDSDSYVQKRNGSLEPFDESRLMERIVQCCTVVTPHLNRDFVDPRIIVDRVKQGMYPNIESKELDTLLIETVACMSTVHPDHSLLAARLAVKTLHKHTDSSFSAAVDRLCAEGVLAEEFGAIVDKHRTLFDTSILHLNDYTYDYFGYKTVENAYLLRSPSNRGEILERPQYMLMRTAIAIHGSLDDGDGDGGVQLAIRTYLLLSNKYYTHATPTLCSAGTKHTDYASCFLLDIKDDSIAGAYDTLKDCALISKHMGGMGMSVHKMRAAGSPISKMNGTANGIVPLLRVFNSTIRFATQGGNKRAGAMTVYLEPWHAEVFEFLELRKNNGAEELRARDLFYALWIPDLFMRRVHENATWCLMCPRQSPGLESVWGDAFERLYTRYENEGRYVKRVLARDLWQSIIKSQVETGTPYMLYKDTVNRCSNQQHLGTVKCSNLCTEIVQYSDPNETAVCILASIALVKFVDESTGAFDFDTLKGVVKHVTVTLNKTIDCVSKSPVDSAHASLKRHRAIGIGVQGYADALAVMRLPYDSLESRRLNRDIFETIYFGALEASCELAERDGVYDSYAGSPASRGLLHFDMCHSRGASFADSVQSQVAPSGRWNWAKLKSDIATHGLRNALLVAPMPTATTSQILGNAESFDPFTSNLYTRRTQVGEFQIVNKHLVRELSQLNLWNEDMSQLIMYHNGSIQDICIIPKEIREVYKTVWEVPVKCTVEMSAERGVYVDQSQSFNVHVKNPTYSRMTSLHFYTWRNGLKTGMYYLRTKPAVNAIPFTVDVDRCVAMMNAMKSLPVLECERSHSSMDTTPPQPTSPAASPSSLSPSSSSKYMSREERTKRKIQSLHHFTKYGSFRSVVKRLKFEDDHFNIPSPPLTPSSSSSSSTTKLYNTDSSFDHTMDAFKPFDYKNGGIDSSIETRAEGATCPRGSRGDGNGMDVVCSACSC